MSVTNGYFRENRPDSFIRTLFPMYAVTVVSFSLYPSGISHYTGIISVSAVAVANLLTCKIYRTTKLGIHTVPDIDSTHPSHAIEFNSMLVPPHRSMENLRGSLTGGGEASGEH